ncbi:phosphoribosylamine--glycine ligase [bacterium]|nr:phosphoribosylamine--glycine ligase [bacterium]
MNPDSKPMRVMVLGVGAFSQGIAHILSQDGAKVGIYLTRSSAHYGPSLEGKTYDAKAYPNPCGLLKDKQINLVLPMSIDWHFQDWAKEFLALDIPILSPIGEGMKLERDRDFAHHLCDRFGIPFPKAMVAKNRLEAEKLVANNPRAYVIKNTLCSPTSPIHTIVCETVQDTLSWLKRVNYEEGVFLQEYMGQDEAGHIAFVSGGEVYSLISNQEYKRAFDGNMGIVAGAPLGGIVEKDTEDRYGLARELLHPLLPWFREVDFHGPVQVTAAHKNSGWSVLEYNVRIGVTCGPIILRMLEDPVDVLLKVAQNEAPRIRFKNDLNYGCSLTLAGMGYPYPNVAAPQLPVHLAADLDCDLWWNDVTSDDVGAVYTAGQRIADVAAVAPTLDEAIESAYKNIQKIRCLSSYYRTDIGRSLWPPGEESADQS